MTKTAEWGFAVLWTRSTTASAADTRMPWSKPQKRVHRNAHETSKKSRLSVAHRCTNS